MNFIEFKILLKGILEGDVKIPEEPSLKIFLLSCLREVALKCEPLSLMTRDLDKDVLSTLKDGLFIREPKISELDNDLIDIDTTLVYAVAFFVAREISRNNKPYFHARGKELCDDYNWKIFNDMKSENFDLEKSILENSLDIHGYKKIYIQKFKTMRGTVYIWDDDFVDTLGKYLSSEILNLSKSDRKNIDDYLDYQMTGIEDNDMYEQLDKYLGEK